MNNRPKCIIEGCNNNAKSRGHNKAGNITFSKLCSSHHNKKYGLPNSSRQRRYWKKRKLFPNNECTLCKWVGPCDRHRIKMGKDGGGYVLGNVIILCPNCHRLLHLGRLSLK